MMIGKELQKDLKIIVLHRHNLYQYCNLHNTTIDLPLFIAIIPVIVHKPDKVSGTDQKQSCFTSSTLLSLLADTINNSMFILPSGKTSSLYEKLYKMTRFTLKTITCLIMIVMHKTRTSSYGYAVGFTLAPQDW